MILILSILILLLALLTIYLLISQEDLISINNTIKIPKLSIILKILMRRRGGLGLIKKKGIPKIEINLKDHLVDQHQLRQYNQICQINENQNNLSFNYFQASITSPLNILIFSNKSFPFCYFFLN